jgi:hypothetical protein
MWHVPFRLTVSGDSAILSSNFAHEVLVVEEDEADELRMPNEPLYGSAETDGVIFKSVTNLPGSTRSEEAESVVSIYHAHDCDDRLSRGTESRISTGSLIFTLLPHTHFQAS